MMILEHFMNKLSVVLSTAWGWAVCVGLIVANFLAGYETMVGFTVAAVVMDAAWGIASSVKQGRFTKSELMRDSLSKLAVYGSVILLFILIDKLLGVGNGLSTSVICICIILVELWSTAASMLICFPNMPFLQLLKKAQEEMLDVMKREDLTDEEKFGNYVRILDDMTDNALSQQGTFNALLEKYRQMAKEKGLDLWQRDSTTQTGKSGAYTTASQESITKLEGLYTAMLVHETNIDTNVENVAGSMQTALGHLKRIDTNTGECSETLKLMRKDMRDMKDDLTTLRRDGIKTR